MNWCQSGRKHLFQHLYLSCSLCMSRGLSLSTLSSTQRPQLCLWPSSNRSDGFRDNVSINSIVIFIYLIISTQIYWVIIHPASVCCRTWAQKAAWSGRSCTSVDRDKSSPVLSCWPCRSCMPSTHRLFYSLSRLECFTTQPSTTRPWQSQSPWQPRSLPPSRSESHFKRSTETLRDKRKIDRNFGLSKIFHPLQLQCQKAKHCLLHGICCAFFH